MGGRSGKLIVSLLIVLVAITATHVRVGGRPIVHIRIKNLDPFPSYSFNYVFVNIPPCEISRAVYSAKTTDGVFTYRELVELNVSGLSRRIAVFNRPIYVVKRVEYRGYPILALAIPRFFTVDGYVYHAEEVDLTLTFGKCSYYDVDVDPDPFIEDITVNKPVYRRPFIDGPEVLVTVDEFAPGLLEWDGMKIVVPRGTALEDIPVPRNAKLLVIVGNATMIRPYYLNFTVMHENYTIATDWPIAVRGGIPQFPVVRIPVDDLAELRKVLSKLTGSRGKWDFVGAEPWIQTNLPKRIANDLGELGYLGRAYLQTAKVEGFTRVFAENLTESLKPGVLGERVLILMHGRENRTVLLRFHSSNGSEYFTVDPINASQWVSLLSNTREVFLLSCLAGSYDKDNSLIERIFSETSATTVVGFSRPALVSIRERPLAGGSFAATLAVWHVMYGGGWEGAFKSVLAYSMMAVDEEERYTWFETVIVSAGPLKQ